MKTENDPFDRVLDRLASSTHSPRGRFAAAESWKLLERRLHRRRSLRRLWMRTASAAAVVLLCVTSWAAYRYFYEMPTRRAPETVTAPAAQPATATRTLTFDQQPLEEIARQLSETFRTEIRIEGDSLKAYRMTATFRAGESLTEILDLLEATGHFTYRKENNVIILYTKLN